MIRFQAPKTGPSASGEMGAPAHRARNAESAVGTKLVKNGQMCVAVDYVLVPRANVEGD